MPLTFNFYSLLQHTTLLFVSPVPLASAYRCAYSPVKFVFIDNHFCMGSGVHLFQAPFCVYALFIYVNLSQHK